MPRLITFTMHRPGRTARTFRQWLVLDRPEVKGMLLEPYEGAPIVMDGRTVLQPGAAALWFVFPGHWYDVGRFHTADGECTGTYTNLCTPVRMSGDDFSSVDLLLDHWLGEDGTARWLDLEEWETARRAGLINADWERHAQRARTAIDAATAGGEWPPSVVREFNLSQARLVRS